MSRLVEYESFKENPFTLEKDEGFFSVAVSSTNHYVDRESGEVVGSKGNYITIDKKPFVKLFKDALPIMQEIKPKGQRVLYEVLMELNKEEDEVYLNASSLATKHGLKNTRDILLGIKDLLDADIICRKAEKDMYFVNVRYLFNGNRVKYSERKK